MRAAYHHYVALAIGQDEFPGSIASNRANN